MILELSNSRLFVSMHGKNLQFFTEHVDLFARHEPAHLFKGSVDHDLSRYFGHVLATS